MDFIQPPLYPYRRLRKLGRSMRDVQQLVELTRACMRASERLLTELDVAAGARKISLPAR
jgi:hypothetical protein